MIARRAADEARAIDYLQKHVANPDAWLPQVNVMDENGLQRQLSPEETRAYMLRGVNRRRSANGRRKSNMTTASR